jgi:ABC-type Fe3+-hydroxamate transport system substrate-binding protein
MEVRAVGTVAAPVSMSADTVVVDGLGRSVPLGEPPRRIVSLVPSLTEALFAFGLRAEVVGRTAYCVEPAALVGGTPTVGGTKTPDLAAIAALQPDLIVASAEENVREHVEALIATGVRVYVSLPDTVRRALSELADLARLTGHEAAARPWLDATNHLVSELAARRCSRRAVRYFCPIWRRPYMVAAPHTYMSDLLSLCGGENIFADGPARYYAVDLSEAAARRPEVVLLPDEPYPFAARHLPEILAFGEMPAVRDGRVHLVDGQWITWYGPRMAAGLRAVTALLEPV